MFGRSFQVVSIVPSGNTRHDPFSVEGRSTARAGCGSLFASVSASQLWAISVGCCAPPVVVVTPMIEPIKALGSVRTATRRTFGVAGRAGWLAPGAPVPGVVGPVQAVATTTNGSSQLPMILSLMSPDPFLRAGEGWDGGQACPIGR